MMKFRHYLIIFITTKISLAQTTDEESANLIQLPVRTLQSSVNSATKLEILHQFKRESSSSTEDVIDVFREYGVPVEVANVPKEAVFSVFRKPHKQAMLMLMNYFENAENLEEMVGLSRVIHPYVNDELFQSAFTNVLMNMEIDTELPRVSESRPQSFVSNAALRMCDQALTNMTSLKKKRQVDQNTVSVQTDVNGVNLVTQSLDLSGTDPLPENRVAYFREDYGMNSHHYNWHLVMTNTANIPRRDEYFIYMHSQMLKRYNIERMAVGVPPVVPYSDFTQAIPVGHLPNVGDTNGEYGTRFDNSRPVDFVDISHKNIAEGQLHTMINQRNINDPAFMQLLEDYHDYGHSNIADTVNNGRDNVMAVPQVSARDNVFYRWHQNIDDFYNRYQAMKGVRATQEEMIYPELQVTDLSVDTSGLTNELVTGCGYHQLDISNGLNFAGQRARVNMIHLDHRDYINRLTVVNNAAEVRWGVVRLFMAPQIGGIEEQRRLWVEMDKFPYQFQPGVNQIIRNAQASSVVVDCRDSFDDIAEQAVAGGSIHNSGHCGCGWPQHLLVPRGTPQGMGFNMFVIITNEPNAQAWSMARSTYCGLPNRELSDQRPMGFPFHGPAPANYATIQDLANALPNAFVNQITIRYTGAPTHPEEDPVQGCGLL